MPVCAEVVARELETVGGGHHANQVARAPLHVLVKLRTQVSTGLEEADQGRDAGGVLIDLRHDAPLFAAACGKSKPGVDEIRAAAAADQRFLVHRISPPEAVKLRRTQQPAGGLNALR